MPIYTATPPRFKKSYFSVGVAIPPLRIAYGDTHAKTAWLYKNDISMKLKVIDDYRSNISGEAK